MNPSQLALVWCVLPVYSFYLSGSIKFQWLTIKIITIFSSDRDYI